MLTSIVVVFAVMLGLVVLTLMYGVGIFNRLVTLRNRVDNAFSQIEVQLKRRYDLIPNLIETVKGYMKHERETLEAVIAARNQAVSGLQNASGNSGDANAIAALAGAEKGLSGALGRLFALAEAYPDLKANQNMAQLTEELTSTENKIGFARQAYNDSVTEYNTYRQTFPPLLIAGVTGHSEDRELLDFGTEPIAEAPKVSF
jgi:LemA protein